MAPSRVTNLLLVCATALVSSAFAANDYPVVLVHGFSGWGRDELLGFKYWGELQGDLQEQLNAQGYKVLTAAVGPFSSNWDRACELYAQIKGGTVDYGKKHSATHGHLQKGRTFKGLYPEWGTKDANGNIRKIHLVGHSMGGQTIRMLTQLLAEGSKGAPIEEDPATSSELFKGGKNNWVHSVTTISTPNQGTLLADSLGAVGDWVEDIVAVFLSTIGLAGDDPALIYDAKLDQWGISGKQPGESLKAYLKRVFASGMFKPGFKDISLWSLSTGGAKEEITWVKTLPNVYYFSYSTEDTFPAKDLLLRNIQLPHVTTMFAPLDPLATFLGSRYGPDHGFGENWQESDGVVNTASMIGDGVAQAVEYNGQSYPGKWNHMPRLERLDHLAVVGFTVHTKVFGVYNKHMGILKNLPVEQPTRIASSGNAINGAVSSLVQDTTSINTVADVEKLCSTTTTPNSEKYCDIIITAAKNATATP